MTKRRMIIVGAGIGGLSMAAELLARDMEVLILEKNGQPGGRAGGWQEAGYRWPRGATAALDAARLIWPFVQAGKAWRDYFDMTRLEVPFCWQREGSVYAWRDDPEQVLAELARRSPRLAADYLDYLADAKGRYDLTDLYERFGSQRYETAGQVFKAYAWDDAWAQWLTFLAAYPGGAMKELPAHAAWQPAVAQLFGVWRVTGGMAAYSQALARLVQEQGGVLRLNEAVEEIVLAGGQAAGVKTGQGFYLADGVVSAVDYHYCLNQLLPAQVEDVYGRAEEDFHHSCGIAALYLLADGQYDGLAQHSIISGRSLTAQLQAACRGKTLRHPARYLHRLPQEADRLTQLVCYLRLPNAYRHPRVWNARAKAKLVKRILQVLARTAGLERLNDEVRAMALATPADFAACYHASGGAAFGLAGDERLWRAGNVKGLYFTGDSVSGGAGVHRVLAHSARAAAAIERELAAGGNQFDQRAKMY